MWLEVIDGNERGSLVNLEKVQDIRIYNNGDNCKVRAYLDSNVYKSNTVDLFEGTSEECTDYMDWIYDRVCMGSGMMEYVRRGAIE